MRVQQRNVVCFVGVSVEAVTDGGVHGPTAFMALKDCTVRGLKALRDIFKE